MTPSPSRPRSAGPLVLAALAGAAHLVVRFFYASAGLIVPGPALLVLWAVWALLAWWLIVLARQRSWWTPVVPVAAVALLAGVITFGESVLGWTA